MKDILEGQGYELQTARNGKEALEQFEQPPPDGVILDLMMPGMGGFEVLQRIRAMEKTTCTPVLILTAKHISQEELSILQGNNIQQLLQKGGINREQLLGAIAAMMKPGSKRTGRATNKPPGLPLVLLVEDNPDNMVTARALLKDSYTLIEAFDGRQAVEQALLHRPALIIMDLSLPVMDGKEALKEIRRHESLREIPVIALTAHAMQGSREEILASGFNGYISKPVDEHAFHQTLKEVLHGR